MRIPILEFDKPHRRRHAIQIAFIIPYDEEINGFETMRKCQIDINGKLKIAERFMLYLNNMSFDVQLDDESWVDFGL